MRSLTKLIFLLPLCVAAQEEGPVNVLRSLGFPVAPAQVRWFAGHGEEAASLGVAATETKLRIQQIRDVTRPELPIIWEKAVDTMATRLSADWHIQAAERWSGQPVLAWRRAGETILLWTATAIGKEGYERYPFLPQALLAAGLKPPGSSRNLWAFFDAGYRQRADVEFLAARWRKSGISAIHVTSWQFDQAGEQQQVWLRNLILACHRHLIHVYAWVELPHVSNQFWDQYPQCREKTAAGTDAQLDWRRLINLVRPDCAALAENRILSLLRGFDWDGVNLGELYFESLEGYGNPSRFTPFNEDVRRAFAARYGHEPSLKPGEVQDFLDYRADLAASLQHEWLGRLAKMRETKPNLDIVLTHIDDRFDPNMRAALGADAARLLRETEGQDLLFLIEDPATTWHLGPKRYAGIRQQYLPLTPNPARLAIDINIVERYQDVYPTKQQSGAELAQLIHQAAHNFDQVALYFEYSLRPEDMPLLGLAASGLLRQEGAEIELRHPTWIRAPWLKEGLHAKVDGTAWPFHDGASVLLPAGKHRLESAGIGPGFQILDCNATILGYEAGLGYEGALHYESRAMAWFRVDRPLEAEMADGTKMAARFSDGHWLLELPRGAHTAKLIPGSLLPPLPASSGSSSAPLPLRP